MAATARILIAEDNADLAFGLCANLEAEGFSVRVAGDGEHALRECRSWQPDLLILDLVMPRLNGYGVLGALRDGGSQVPVLILSANQEETAKIQGFRLGADDFVTKPFGVLELMARVHALLRRAARTAPQRDARIRFSDVVVDLATQEVLRAGQRVELSPRTFELLAALLKRRGGVARRDELLRDVWGYTLMVPTRTVDVHMLELRKKLETDPANPTHFLTVRKAGYRFQP